jgi:hypothetical protein
LVQRAFRLGYGCPLLNQYSLKPCNSQIPGLGQYWLSTAVPAASAAGVIYIHGVPASQARHEFKVFRGFWVGSAPAATILQVAVAVVAIAAVTVAGVVSAFP